MTETPDAGSVILWRWCDAVVLGQSRNQVCLWEPAHGEVVAQVRTPEGVCPVGTRAYASAGLRGADWRVEGPVTAVEDMVVAIDEVLAFDTEHDLWERLT